MNLVDYITLRFLKQVSFLHVLSIDSVGTESLSYVSGTLRPLHKRPSSDCLSCLASKWKVLDYAVEKSSVPSNF